ncbi:unnamed protein product, partial [Polarella glacialis]
MPDVTSQLAARTSGQSRRRSAAGNFLSVVALSLLASQHRFALSSEGFALVRRRRTAAPGGERQEPTADIPRPFGIPSNGPMVPWDVTFQQELSAAPGSLGAMNASVTGLDAVSLDPWAVSAAEARAQDLILGPGEPLPVPSGEGFAHIVREQGVVRIPRALRADTAAALREFVLAELAQSQADVAAQPVLQHQRFSKNIRQTQAAANIPQTRWELQLPLTALTEAVLAEVLAGPLAHVWEELAGGLDAELWEFTAM